jgi:hypothetical protein
MALGRFLHPFESHPRDLELLAQLGAVLLAASLWNPPILASADGGNMT